jgi:hypothetical protein
METNKTATKENPRGQKKCIVLFYVLWYSAAINTVLHSTYHYFALPLGLKTRGRKFDTRRHSSRRPYRDAVDGVSRHPSSGSRLRQITVYLTVDLTYDG